ncbi:MAG: acyl-[acyl-carrier-protein]--UDP-N-acetylglucosamine O-acyltransferase, partial [Candidatus Raymondbacteria bacterium RifOxyB12_full_50_8]
MATDIHPTAVIEAGAVVEDGCRIGAYCVIGANVRLGAGCRLHSHVVVDGHTTVGPGCEIFSFACIGKQTQDLKYKGGVCYVEIGSNTVLREYVTVHAATTAGNTTSIGNDCHILAYNHVAHECKVGNHVIMSNACQLAGHVTVEDAVVFGGLVGVHQFVRIGRMAMMGATSKAVQDIAPYCLADGSPAQPVTINKVGMQRNGRSEDAVSAVTKAFRILFRSSLTLEAALTQLEQEYPNVAEVKDMIQFARTSERGLARPKP